MATQFCVFERFWELGATYDDHLKFIGKRVGGFLVLIGLFR